MTVKTNTNNMRSRPAMDHDPLHHIRTRKGTTRLLAALWREHPRIVAHLTGSSQEAKAHHHAG